LKILKSNTVEIELNFIEKKIFSRFPSIGKRIKLGLKLLIPIILSLADSYSDANYCFNIASGHLRNPYLGNGVPAEEVMLSFLFFG